MSKGEKLYKVGRYSNAHTKSYQPTICPNCKTVYQHQNKIKCCSFCSWKNPEWKRADDLEMED